MSKKKKQKKKLKFTEVLDIVTKLILAITGLVALIRELLK